MSVADIKESIKALSEEERGEIANFISDLRVTKDRDYWSRIRRRIDDKRPDHWIPLEKIISSED